MRLKSAQIDRASGVLLGQACGDALGVPYEFAPALATGEVPRMSGGGLGGYAPGEWSDDTQMAVCIAQVTADGTPAGSDTGMSGIAGNFLRWLDSHPADIGAQTSAVLGSARRGGGDQVGMLDASRVLHERTGRTAGNGALMRTGIIGVTRLDDRGQTAAAARAVAELTHWDPVAGDSCVLWSEAVRRAAVDGVLDLRSGLDLLPLGQRDRWARWVEEAQTREPGSFTGNGYTVTALQAAWSAIVHTDHGDGDPAHLVRALHAAVRIGHDTDTVAAIAGALLGARYGVSAVPFDLRRTVHGWPGLRARDLVHLAYRTAVQGQVRPHQWPLVAAMDTGDEALLAVPLPGDPDVLMGTTADLHRATELGVDAVVSLCRLGMTEFAPEGIRPEDHAEIWLLDSEDPAANQHLGHVLDEAAAAVRQLRHEGRRVLLHCVAAHHRTPSVALRYAVHAGTDPADAAHQIGTALGSPGITGLLWQRARS